jgi:hypothetical protein
MDCIANPITLDVRPAVGWAVELVLGNAEIAEVVAAVRRRALAEADDGRLLAISRAADQSLGRVAHEVAAHMGTVGGAAHRILTTRNAADVIAARSQSLLLTPGRLVAITGHAADSSEQREQSGAQGEQVRRRVGQRWDPHRSSFTLGFASVRLQSPIRGRRAAKLRIACTSIVGWRQLHTPTGDNYISPSASDRRLRLVLVNVGRVVVDAPVLVRVGII